MKTLCVFLSLILGICLAGIGCTPTGSSNGRLHNPGSPVTIFITGNVLSTLKPCGCSSGQLGGLDRRGAVLATVPADRRLVMDTGNLLVNDGPQDMIKLGIMLQAMAKTPAV